MSNNENEVIGLGNIGATNVDKPTEYKKSTIGTIPGEDSPLVCKLIPDVRNRLPNGKFPSYWAITEHSHITGINPKTQEPMTGTHPCQKSMGEKFCPECDAYYKMKKQVDVLGEKSPEGKKLKSLVDLLAPINKGWVYYITPESDVVKALKLPKSVINLLWGKEKTSYKPAIPSLIDAMQKDGISPFDLKSPIGWIKIFKSGEGRFGTNYFVEEAKSEKVVMKNGRPAGKEVVYFESEVSNFVVTSYPIKDLLNFRDMTMANAFTREESELFAQNPKVTPQRILDKRRSPRDAEILANHDSAETNSTEMALAAVYDANTEDQGNFLMSDVDAIL